MGLLLGRPLVCLGRRCSYPSGALLLATLVPVGRVAAAAGDLMEATCSAPSSLSLFLSSFLGWTALVTDRYGTHTHACMYTCAHAYIHKCSCLCTHRPVYVCACTQTCMCTHLHTTHMYTPRYMDMCTHALSHVYLCAHRDTCTYAHTGMLCVHAHIHMCLCAQGRTCVHVHRDTRVPVYGWA